MAQASRSMRFNRLAIAVAFTLLVADTVLHPSLGPGLIESELRQLQPARHPWAVDFRLAIRRVGPAYQR